MKAWLMEQVIKYILDNLTKDKIEEMLKNLDTWAKPKITAKKDELFKWIDEQVASTATPLDDALGQIAKNAIDYYLK